MVEPTIPDKPAIPENDTPEGKLGCIVQFTRGMIRPSITWIGFGVLSFIVVYKTVVVGEAIPEFYQTLVVGIISVWFTARIMSK